MKMEGKKRLIDANEVERKIRIAISSWQRDCNSNAPVIARAMEDALQRVIYAPTVNAVELPPIKIGDTAYFILDRKVYRAEVYYIRWSHHERFGISSEISASVSTNSSVGASFDDFGKTMFLTEEEANAALAKMLEKED